DRFACLWTAQNLTRFAVPGQGRRAAGAGTGRPPDGGSGERDQVLELGVPHVLDAVGQQDDPLRLERVDRALVVGDQHDRALVVAQRAEDLLPAGRVEV